MQKQIISKTIMINKPSKITTETIEELLNNSFGEVLRWAVIESTSDYIKICITYEE